jgi:phosphonate transport system substrate-binding protein
MNSAVSFPRLLVIGLVLAALGAGGYYFFAQQAQQGIVPVDELRTLKTYLATQAGADALDPKFTDADGDLVADTPAQTINPPELVFSGVFSDDPAKAAAEYKQVMESVAQATGKPVTYSKAPPAPPAPPPAPDEEGTPPPAPGGRTFKEQLDDLAAGKLHVTAFSTGQVPTAVATAGFVPLVARADGGSTKYEMELIVPADSPVKSPADLPGKTVALVALSSNSGGKAPLVVLKEQFKLLPGKDYRFTFAGSHDLAIKAVAAGKADAAAVANDILVRLTADGTVPAGKVRSVFKSAAFPRVCFGVSHALDPAVRAAVLKGLTEATAPKLAPVAYKADWQDVREIDRKLTKLLD